MDQLRRARLPRDFQLRIVHVDRNRSRSAKRSRRDRPQSHAPAAKYSDRIPVSHATACNCMEAHGQRLYQAQFTQRQRRRVELFRQKQKLAP